MASLDRFEVFLDDTPEPRQVLKAPPYRLQLETAALAEGEHQLRIVAVYSDGRRQERRLSFNVDNPSDIQVLGLAQGETVRGPIELSLDFAQPSTPEVDRRRFSLFRVLSVFVVLGGVWALFAFLSPVGNILAAIGGQPSASEGAAGKPPVTQAAMQRGEEIFSQQCSVCHGKKGEGIPGAFPPLAGNSRLEDARAVVTAIHQGLSGPLAVEGQRYNGQMPAFAQLTAHEVAAVATYIRNSFGNRFGGISEEQASRIVSGVGAAAPPVDNSLLSAGKSLYREHCAGCHQESGGGVPGAALPPLAGNPHLSSIELIAHAITGGQAGPILVNDKEYNGQMPPVPNLSAQQVAALATYVRNSFGNHFGGASVAEVKRALAASPASGNRQEKR